MSSRRIARTLALQVLSQWDFNQSFLSPKTETENTIQYILKEFAPPVFKEKKFFEKLVKEILANVKEIDSLIVKYAPQWPLEKITLTDRNILRIGIFELLISPENPPRVIINEAVEIAKSFGSDTSGKFINGVLGAIYEEIKKNE
ncbi:transcription antitermination factor NusB [Patescibacteria group bacterium]|nr:transcription antitermination factor NusB [Patescibacteria group bacterium]